MTLLQEAVLSILRCYFLCAIAAAQIPFSNGPHPCEQVVDCAQLPLSEENCWLSTQENEDHRKLINLVR